MKNNAYTSQQNSHTHQKMSLLNHVYTSNSHIFIPIENQKKKKKIESKFIHQFPKLHTMQSSINHQHCLNLTISNNSTIQKFLKNQHDHTMISIQIIQYPKIPTRANNNKTTMPHHKVLNQTRNQQIYQPKKKEKKRMRSP